MPLLLALVLVGVTLTQVPVGPNLKGALGLSVLKNMVFPALVALLGRFAALGLQRRIGRINLAFREPQDGAGLAAAGRIDGDEIDGPDPVDQLAEGRERRDGALCRRRNA